MNLVERMIEVPVEHEQNVCGQLDKHVKQIERTLNVTIVARNGQIKLIGEKQNVDKAKSVFLNLIELSKRDNIITEQNVNYALALSMED
ncbi:MAG: phosphate starvation-inducible protein PhoH, partial [Lachnospiraceae bacterium]|nr:phosphate starvation-inducible protein PhoH [Lachnospiraceae bacterium]